MASNSAVPIIVGVGDFQNHSRDIQDAVEPAELMVEAITRALTDTQLEETQQEQLLACTHSISGVPPWTWV